MAIIVVALLIILILGGLGFALALHFLWWVAIAALIIWLLGFVLRVGETIARPRRRRWYYW